MGNAIQRKLRAQAQALAQQGIYPQAYRSDEDPTRWSMRWVRTLTPIPTAGKPYSILGALTLPSSPPPVAQTVFDATAVRTRIEAQMVAAFAHASGALQKEAATKAPGRTHGDPGDYAWVPRRDLPIACPYPYPYLPVPQEDYVTGRWLEPGYVPSIPLPPPHSEVPWRCGSLGTVGTKAPRDVTRLPPIHVGPQKAPWPAAAPGAASHPPSAYAWLSQDALPVGCPYPYSVMPVPLADYRSGRWLEKDYVPSIPLPYPYDQVRWQCGITGIEGKAKGKPSTPTGMLNLDVINVGLAQLGLLSWVELDSIEDLIEALLDQEPGPYRVVELRNALEQVDAARLANVASRSDVELMKLRAFVAGKLADPDLSGAEKSKLKQALRDACKTMERRIEAQLHGDPNALNASSLVGLVAVIAQEINDPSTAASARTRLTADLHEATAALRRFVLAATPAEKESIAAAANMHLPGEPGGLETLMRAAFAHAGVETPSETPDELKARLAELMKLAASGTNRGPGDIDTIQAEIEELQSKLRIQGEAGRYGLKPIEPPQAVPPADVWLEPKPGDDGDQPSPLRQPRYPSGLRIRCEFPSTDMYPPPPAAGWAAGSKYGQDYSGPEPSTCAEAIQEFLDRFNAALQLIAPDLELRPLHGLPTTDYPKMTYLVLVDKKTGQPPTPESHESALAEAVYLINNGDVGLEDPHATGKRTEYQTATNIAVNESDPRDMPTTIYLCNRNCSYRDPATEDIAHVGVTAAQDGADGVVRVNMSAVSAWSEVLDAWSTDHGDIANPFNLAVNVFHEVFEHFRGQKAVDDWLRPHGTKRSKRQQGQPAPDPEGEGNAYAKERADDIARGHVPYSTGPVPGQTPGREKYFFRESGIPGDREMPSTFKAIFEFSGVEGHSRKGRVEVPMDWQGVPIGVPTIQWL